MVRTGARANALEALLIKDGLRPNTAQPPAARVEHLPDDLKDQIFTLYRDLGGRVEAPTLRPGKWDLAFHGDLVVELDEELHFNRYRALTLSGAWARRLPWTSDYLKHCADREERCLADGRWGKRWTNPSCERLFGAADTPGSFAASGAPRWKQRALYDAIKDACALAGTGLRLVRLAVYDKCDDIELGQLLLDPQRAKPDAIFSLVEMRAIPD